LKEKREIAYKRSLKGQEKNLLSKEMGYVFLICRAFNDLLGPEAGWLAFRPAQLGFFLYGIPIFRQD